MYLIHSKEGPVFKSKVSVSKKRDTFSWSNYLLVGHSRRAECGVVASILDGSAMV